MTILIGVDMSVSPQRPHRGAVVKVLHICVPMVVASLLIHHPFASAANGVIEARAWVPLDPDERVDGYGIR